MWHLALELGGLQMRKRHILASSSQLDARARSIRSITREAIVHYNYKFQDNPRWLCFLFASQDMTYVDRREIYNRLFGLFIDRMMIWITSILNLVQSS